LVAQSGHVIESSSVIISQQQMGQDGTTGLAPFPLSAPAEDNA